MSNLTLDGSTSFIGTEFIKLLATGSSNLATEEYVDDAIAQGGGGNGNVDLSNYYTQTETDNLLNNKLNVNNPQDIIGNLRIDSTNGNGKIIINAVAPATATDDFYCNGTGHFNGSLRVSVLTSDGDVNADGCNADTFNSHIIANDIIFKHNDVEYMRFNATDDEIQLSKNIDVGSSTLICNNFDSGLSDVVFNLNSSEFLRFQVSDSTVRVPNTKSFLSQNLFSDIIKPIAISNDISLQGQNSTNDGYEEYFKINSTTKKVDFNKIVNFDEDVVMQQTKKLYLDNTANLQRYITTRRDNSQDILELVNNKATNNQIRFTNNATTSLIVDNSFIYTPRQIQGDNGLKVDFLDTRNTTADFEFRRNGTQFFRLDTSDDNIICSKEIVAGGGIKCNTYDSDGDSNVIFKRFDTSLITLNSSNQVQLSGDLSLPTSNTQYIRFPNCNIRQGVAGDPAIVYFDFNNDTSTGQYRFFIDSSTILHLRPLTTTISNTLEVNTINSSGINDVIFKRNDISKLELYNDRVNINNEFRVTKTSDSDNFRIQFSNHLDCYSGSGGANTMLLNYYSKGNVFLGSDQAVKPTVTVNKFSSDSGNAFEVGGNSVFSGTVSTNTLNSEGDNDLVFQRNGVEYFRLDDLTGTDILNVANDKGVSASYVFGNRFWNRSFSSDTTFFGSNVAGDDRVEYMRWNYLSQSVDYNAPIDNTGLAITGNIIDTTVSDERLKTNIEDVESNYCDCVKNVKIKTFEYKDEKYKNNDKYGMIAQDLRAHLPKEFENIVKENKDKHSDDKYLSINYMKLSVVLWGALQEEINKREHIESRLFELEDIVKELKGKKTTKPKAKAKSKSENK